MLRQEVFGRRRAIIVEMANEGHGRLIEPGTKVRHDGLEDGPEFGVVVHCWHEPEIGGYDCYVAFFGADFPAGRPNQKPYILRYAVASLQVLAD